MIEGGASRNFIRTKKLMYTDETLWRRLMGKIVDVLAPFAHLQVTAGARAIQVFDTWVGTLGSDDYVRFARALFACPHRAHPLHRRSRDPLRHRRFRFSSASSTPPAATSWASTGASISTRLGWTSAIAPPSKAPGPGGASRPADCAPGA